MILKSLTVLYLFCFLSIVNAQGPGSFDHSFDDDGIQILPIGTANAFGRALAIQPDRKAVMACIANNGTDTDFAIVRFTTDGDPDQSLGEDGIVMTDFDGRSDIAEAIALDQHDRIIVAGSSDSGDGFGFAAARYLPGGTLDTTFGDHGWVTRKVGITDFCKAVAVQADNKIVMGGYVLNEISQTNEFALMRYNTDGTPDSTFSEDGIVMTNMDIGAGVANAMLLQPDDKIVLAGQVLNEATFHWEIGIVRYNEDGSLDETWGEDGIVFTGSMDADFTIKAVAIQPDLKILAGGYFGTAPSNNLFAVARYHVNGEPDDSFGTNGLLLGSYGAQDNQINTMVIQPDGHILIAGTSLQGNRDLFAIARLEANGNFDHTFGEFGVVRPVIGQNDGIHSMALQQDGKLVVAGESFNGQRFSIAIARMETGIATHIENPDRQVIDVSIYPNPIAEHFTVSYQLLHSGPVRITLFNASGSLISVLSDHPSQGPFEYQERFDLPDTIQAGVYCVVVSTDEGSQAFKIFVNRT